VSWTTRLHLGRGSSAQNVDRDPTIIPDHHDLIVDLEAEIYELHHAVERCRKIDLQAKAILVGGCVTVGMSFI
jgi:hypothetical protein